MTDVHGKRCPGCRATLTMQQIIACNEVQPLGMQVIGPDLKGTVYYFNHIRPGCGTTFLMPVMEFLPFITESIPEEILTGTDRCEHHCLTMADLAECGQPCLYSPFRRFLIGLRKRSKAVVRPSGNAPAPAVGCP